MQVKVKQEVVFDATTILVNANVRYWEDGEINGVDDYPTMPTMPCAVKGEKGYRWMPIIDIETGQIRNWREGTTAEIHYKVCDEFECRIIDEKGGERCLIKDYEGYVPDFMCPKDRGYGDYIIMDIDENGYIQDWDKDEVLNFIENEEEYVMIKSKIDARERALELVASLGLHDRELIMDMAKEFTDFLIGDAELPEVFDDNGHLKEFIEMAKKGMEDINKRNDDLFGDIIKTLPEDVIRDKGLVGLIPCKSEAE